MKTSVRDTSIEAFYQLQKQLNRRERQLLEMLEKIQPASDRDLAKKLDWEPNMVTGRRNALMQKGVVIISHKAISPITRKRVIYWKTNGQRTDPRQEALFEAPVALRRRYTL